MAAASALDALMASVFDADDDDDEVAKADAPADSADIAAGSSGGPVPLASAAETATALLTVCSTACTAAGVLETASRFLLHLSSGYYDAAVRRPAQNLALLAQAQEEELAAALAQAAQQAESAADGAIVSDKSTSALVKRHHGQRREAAERHRTRRREASKTAVSEFSTFVLNAASDFAHLVATSDASGNSPTSPSGPHLVSDAIGVTPLVDFDVAADVAAVQLTCDNPLANTLLDGQADPTAPPLVVDVSPVATLPICLRLVHTGALDAAASSSSAAAAAASASGAPTALELETASARRIALQLRRIAQRRHGVLVYCGAWREFRALIDDARRTAVDPLWSGDDLRESDPTAGGKAADSFTVCSANLWGASIAVFVPCALGPDQKHDGPRLARVLRRVFTAAATTWRADMVSAAFAPSLDPPRKRAAGDAGPALSDELSHLQRLIRALLHELAAAARECHVLRNLTQLPCAPLVPSGGSARAPGYALGMSLRLFLPVQTIDDVTRTVGPACPGAVREVARRR